MYSVWVCSQISPQIPRVEYMHRLCCFTSFSLHLNKFDEASEARRSTLPGTFFRDAAPKSKCQGQHLCRAALRRGSHCLVFAGAEMPTACLHSYKHLAIAALLPHHCLAHSHLSSQPFCYLSPFLSLCCHNFQHQLLILQACLCSASS